MRRSCRISLVILAALLLSGAAGFYVLPWRDLAARQMQRMLREATGQETVFALESFGLTQSRLRDFRLGAAPVLLPEISLHYDLTELRQGRLRRLHLQGLALILQETAQGWRLEGWHEASSSGEAGLALPLSETAVAALPLRDAAMTGGALTLQGLAWRAHLPFNLQWVQAPRARLDFTSAGLNLQAGAYGVQTGAAAAHLIFVSAAKSWQGEWVLGDIALQGLENSVPTLRGKGAVALDAQGLDINGHVASADKTWQANFAFRRPHDPRQAPYLRVLEARMPWQGGWIRLRDLHWPLDGKAPLQAMLVIEKIPLQPLLRQVIGEEARGSGSVSGSLPFTRHADGRLTVKDARLRTDTAGIVAVPPGLIPGDNPQIALLRDILGDLHYEFVSLGLAGTPEGKLQASLAVAGHNPAVQQGKPVNLNVNLGGDVLEFLRHQFLSLTDPAKLLQESHDAK